MTDTNPVAFRLGTSNVWHRIRPGEPNPGNRWTALCGVGADYMANSSNVTVTVIRPGESYNRYTRACLNCDAARVLRRGDLVQPEPESKAAVKGEQIATSRGQGIVEIPGRLFRVAGSEGRAYTVTVPADHDVAITCTCKASKIHPELLCKHAAAVTLATRHFQSGSTNE